MLKGIGIGNNEIWRWNDAPERMKVAFVYCIGEGSKRVAWTQKSSCLSRSSEESRTGVDVLTMLGEKYVKNAETHQRPEHVATSSHRWRRDRVEPVVVDAETHVKVSYPRSLKSSFCCYGC